jgi:predicted metalloprotease with PDZ domain
MKRTGAAKSFDDVILAMWKAYREEDAGFDTEEVREICEKVAGGSLESIFADYVYGVKEVPFEEYLKIAGYDLVADTEKMKKMHKGASLGARYAEKEGKVVVTHVRRDTEAWLDGVNFEDEIIAFDGLRIHSPRELDLQLELRKPGDEVSLWVGRQGRVEELSVTMESHRVPLYKIVEVANPSDLQIKIRNKWLKIEGS